ncbi:MAG: hypothetical protein GY909_12395 [Oligoflexia bacterium]|nr:hypothetical protein [Oligoflexia bacterium]
MIFLEVTNSPDPDFISPYEFYFKSISVGSSKKSNLYFPFKEIRNYHLKISLISDDKVSVKNIDAKYYYSNGKKVSGDKVHTIGDTVKIGDIEFRFTKLNLSSIPVTDYEQLFRDAYNRGAQSEFFLEQLEHELKNLEDLC